MGYKLFALLITVLMAVLFITGCTEKPTECLSDSDCVPDACCHPTGCALKDKALDCSDVYCTMICDENSMDCGQGSCICKEGKCSVEWNEEAIEQLSGEKII
ncbi:hypothetical protein HZB88_02010 [archaeon]|nr:hypothetical protein [archaeon]